MIIIKDNAERIIDEKEYPLYKKQGYISLDKNDPEMQSDIGQKSLKKMTVTDLKAIAQEKGIENAESLTKTELLKVLKENGCN